MEGRFSRLSRSVSVIDRLMKMYYNRALEDFGIGWGQQFYVEYLYDHPGASAQEMAECIRVDKATLTKVVRKLSRIGFLESVTDGEDRRIRHLYLTERAIPAARRIKEVHAAFYQAFSENIPPEDLRQTEQVLEQVVKNITSELKGRK